MGVLICLFRRESLTTMGFPEILQVMGSIGRLPDSLLGLASTDIVRLVDGANSFHCPRSLPALLEMIETALAVHPIREIRLKGPWRFIDIEPVSTEARRKYFLDRLKSAQDIVQKTFPKERFAITVEVDFDELLFQLTDWETPPTYQVLYLTCMDPRLDPLLRQLRDKYHGGLLIMRWPGAASLLARSTSPFRNCFREQLRIIMTQGAAPIERIQFANHRGCAALGGPAPSEEDEVILHTPYLQTAVEIVQNIFLEEDWPLPANIEGLLSPYGGELVTVVTAHS